LVGRAADARVAGPLPLAALPLPLAAGFLVAVLYTTGLGTCLGATCRPLEGAGFRMGTGGGIIVPVAADCVRVEGVTPGVAVGEPKLSNVSAAALSAPRVRGAGACVLGEAVVLLRSRTGPAPRPGAVEGPGAAPTALPLPLPDGKVLPAVVTCTVRAGGCSADLGAISNDTECV
jgi:hypothetical protein